MFTITDMFNLFDMLKRFTTTLLKSMILVVRKKSVKFKRDVSILMKHALVIASKFPLGLIALLVHLDHHIFALITN
jgi:hypothetical protein